MYFFGFALYSSNEEAGLWEFDSVSVREGSFKIVFSVCLAYSVKSSCSSFERSILSQFSPDRLVENATGLVLLSTLKGECALSISAFASTVGIPIFSNVLISTGKSFSVEPFDFLNRAI